MDLFNAVKCALDARDLEISASTFISDFEHNIRTSWSAVFPKVEAKGCHFHYAKVRVLIVLMGFDTIEINQVFLLF